MVLHRFLDVVVKLAVSHHRKLSFYPKTGLLILPQHIRHALLPALQVALAVDSRHGRDSSLLLAPYFECRLGQFQFREIVESLVDGRRERGVVLGSIGASVDLGHTLFIIKLCMHLINKILL